jgi:hypothetical protein
MATEEEYNEAIAQLTAEQAKYQIGSVEYNALQGYIDQVEANKPRPPSTLKDIATIATSKIPGATSGLHFYPIAEDRPWTLGIGPLGPSEEVRRYQEWRRKQQEEAPRLAEEWREQIRGAERRHPGIAIGADILATAPMFLAGPLAGPLIAGAYQTEQALERGVPAKEAALRGGITAALGRAGAAVARAPSAAGRAAGYAAVGPVADRIISMLERGEFKLVGENELMLADGTKIPLSLAISVVPGVAAAASAPIAAAGRAVAGQPLETVMRAGVKPSWRKKVERWEGMPPESKMPSGVGAQVEGKEVAGPVREYAAKILGGTEEHPGILDKRIAASHREAAQWAARSAKMGATPVSPKVVQDVSNILLDEIEKRSSPVAKGLIPLPAKAEQAKALQDKILWMEEIKKGGEFTWKELNSLKQSLHGEGMGDVAFRLDEAFSLDPTLSKFVTAQKERSARRARAEQETAVLVGEEAPETVLVESRAQPVAELRQIANELLELPSGAREVPLALRKRATNNAIRWARNVNMTPAELEAFESIFREANARQQANILQTLVAADELKFGMPSVAIRTSSGLATPTARFFSFLNPMAIGARAYDFFRNWNPYKTPAVPVAQAKALTDEEAREKAMADRIRGIRDIEAGLNP